MPASPLIRLLGITLLGLPLAARAQTLPEPPSPRPDVRLYRVANGFEPETFGPNGVAQGTGFAKPNRWGQYTAYLLATNAAGQRTWRLEHYLPLPGTGFAQGSTMYLVEGGKRALLIDTANPAAFTPGVNDLKTVVRYLLSHDEDGGARAHPLDFVVANTHNHGDHIGENTLMGDRTVYYMDGDWPASAPANYVPIREGGGRTTHGNGTAAAAIDLGGGRVLTALALAPHTPGSIAYLDAANRMLFSGDGMGSAWPWLQWASIVTYAKSMHHIEQATRAYPDLIVFPAHYYQTHAFGRDGRPLDRRYILDQVALADGLLAGTIEGEPYPWHHSGAWAGHGTARLVYTLDHLADPNQTLPVAYHALRLPGGYRREWTANTPPPGQDIDRLSDMGAEVHLIRQTGGPTLFLVKGSAAALLIGTGSGAPGLAAALRPLVGALPLDVALLDGGHEQVGGLAQLKPRRVFVADGAHGGMPLRDGETITLGVDTKGRPLVLEAQTLQAGALSGLTLRSVADRMMFAGAVLGRHTDPTDAWADAIVPFRIDDPAGYQIALTDWSSRTIGRYDALYLSGSADWYLSPEYITELEQALTAANIGRKAATAEPGASPGLVRHHSMGAKDVRAVIDVPAAQAAQ